MTSPATVTTTPATVPVTTPPAVSTAGFHCPKNSLKLDKFDGHDKDLRVQTWLKLFDVHTNGQSDADKIHILLYNLKGAALEWYGDEIAGKTKLTWPQVQAKMFRRFGIESAHPLIDAQKMHLSREQTVEEYYLAKIRLLNQTTLCAEEKVQMLTDGLPFTWKVSLAPLTVRTTDIWLEAVQRLEAIHSKPKQFNTQNNPKPFNKTFNKNKSKPNTFLVSTSNQSNQQKKPNTPCRFCKRLGREEFHWHSQCPNRANTGQTPNTHTSNASQNTTQPNTNTTNIVSTNTPSIHTIDTQNVCQFINVDVKLNHKPIKAFIDTGSSITVISEKTQKALKLKTNPNSSITVNLAEGSTNTLGSVDTDLQIANKTEKNTVHVLKDFKYPLLLGLDAGKRFGLTIDLSDHTVSMRSETTNKECFSLNLEPTQRQKLDSLLIKHKQIFSQNETDIGRIKSVTHSIITVPHPPIQIRSYRRPQTENDKMKALIKDLIEKKLIRESSSNWSFPTLFVKKKDGSDRMCINYRALNAITIDDKMPLPRIQEILDRLSGKKYFTTLDVAWGYWHVEMDPASIDKTAFITNEGLYEWLVMPFGLKNAPATFQRIIQKVLGELLYNGAINYLDDIIIYSETFEEHIQLLDKIFNKLKEYGIKLKQKKCSFAQTEVQYLGHIVSHNQVRPSLEKIAAINDFPVPNSVRSVKSFLGLAGYFRRFVKDFSRIARPLNQLTHKDTPFRWSEDCQQAFAALIKTLTSKPVLALYNPNNPCRLYTDASGDGIGAILTQFDDKNEEHPIEYFSRSLLPHQKNYIATELECLAVVEAVEHFEVYLHLPFTVITDHSALQWLLTLKKPKGRVYRWSVRLSTYPLKIEHRAGKLQTHVDALSRNPLPIPVHTYTVSTNDLITAQQTSDLSFVQKPIVRNNVITVKQNGLFKAVVPQSLKTQILTEFHDNHSHPGKNKTVSLINQYYWWPNHIRETKAYVDSCKTCQLAKYTHRPTFGKYICPTPDLQPFELIGLDTIVMGAAADKTQHKYIQVLIDHHSRHMWAYPSVRNNSATIINIFTNLINSGVNLNKILTDNYRSFLSADIKTFFRRNNIKHIVSTPYHPQTNGIVERANGTIITKLRAALLDHPRRKWTTLLPEIVQNYNRTPHDITGFTPRYLLYGISDTPSFGTPPEPLERARQLARERTHKHQGLRKQRHDAKHLRLDLTIGSRVVRQIASNDPSQIKTSPRWSGPYYITAVIGENTYEISETLSGPAVRAHISQLKEFVQREQIPQPGGNVTDHSSLTQI